MIKISTIRVARRHLRWPFFGATGGSSAISFFTFSLIFASKSAFVYAGLWTRPVSVLAVSTIVSSRLINLAPAACYLPLRPVSGLEFLWDAASSFSILSVVYCGVPPTKIEPRVFESLWIVEALRSIPPSSMLTPAMLLVAVWQG